MKNIFLFCFCLVSSFSLIAQEKSDTTRFKIGRHEFIIVESDTIEVSGDDDDGSIHVGHKMGDKNALTYWSGFEIGVNVPMNGDFQNSFSGHHLQTDPGNSFVFSFNLLEQRIKIIGDYFGIVTGIGFTNSRYGFKDAYTTLNTVGDTTFGVLDSTYFRGFTKNQLRVNTFNIPILFQINTSKYHENNFHVAFGVIGGLKMGANVKYKYEVPGGKESKTKEKGDYNLNAFQLTGTVRIGYKDFGLFANYNVLSLYDDGASELAYPFSFGASFHF
ncbi:outer membrane beta-barrel protein [Crocinitomix catalasitica]|uniref:outer membrane beta-barrel protein n=1 Tax=Crocinitomix catalasitica TaxID=184607 RepID=UPI000A030E35|nr:outer membrane beta-barrel protein [Crocinitomix catalasitica]